MDIFDRIELLMKQNGVSAYRVAKETGLSNGLFSQWKRRLQTPSADKLQKIADYFNVSVDYLLTGEDNKKSPAEPAEDDFQFALLNGTQNLTEEGKKELLAYKDYLFHKYIKKDN